MYEFVVSLSYNSGVKSTRLTPSRNLHTLSMRAFIFRHDFSISSRTFLMGCILLYTEEQSQTRRKKQGSRTLCRLLWVKKGTMRPGDKIMTLGLHFHLDAKEEATL